jgi:aspartate kinase
VVPGFFGSGADGRLRLLGRGGSDTAATLLGAALGADRVEIWTDVDGVYPRDPRHDSAARPFVRLGFDEAERLAMAGARVLHSRSMAPVRAARVPVVVRNSFRPKVPGTWIGPVPERALPARRPDGPAEASPPGPLFAEAAPGSGSREGLES